MKPLLPYVGYVVVLPILSPILIVALLMWFSKWLTDEPLVGPTIR